MPRAYHRDGRISIRRSVTLGPAGGAGRASAPPLRPVALKSSIIITKMASANKADRICCSSELLSHEKFCPPLIFPNGLRKRSCRAAPWAAHTFFFFLSLFWGLHHFFSSLLGPFYKKVAVSSGPGGTYYSILVVINHRGVSIPTQRLPRVSSGHSLTVSSAISFLSTCPLLRITPTWALWNWPFSC